METETKIDHKTLKCKKVAKIIRREYGIIRYLR